MTTFTIPIRGTPARGPTGTSGPAGRPTCPTAPIACPTCRTPRRSPRTITAGRAGCAFRGPTVPSYVWPPADDTEWSDVYFPNNAYGASNSIHQVNDDETPYLQKAVAGHSAGQSVTLTVFGHTPFLGRGPYSCEVYDYSGCWVTITLPDAAAKARLEAAVPPYAVLRASRIRVRLTAPGPYGITAAYPAPAVGPRR